MSNTINTIQIKRGTTAPGENTLLPYELGYTVNRYLNGSALVENSGGGYLYIGDLKQGDATKSLPVKIKAGYADTTGCLGWNDDIPREMVITYWQGHNMEAFKTEPTYYPVGASNENCLPTQGKWWHILRFNHSNVEQLFYTDLAIPFTDKYKGLCYKQVNNGEVKDNKWITILDESNCLDYVPNGAWPIEKGGTGVTTHLEFRQLLYGGEISSDTVQQWGQKGISVFPGSQTGASIAQPSDYGFILNLTTAHETAADVAQLWLSLPDGSIYRRQGYKNWYQGGKETGSGEWTLLLDKYNLTIPLADGSLNYGSINSNETCWAINLKSSYGLALDGNSPSATNPPGNWGIGIKFHVNANAEERWSGIIGYAHETWANETGLKFITKNLAGDTRTATFAAGTFTTPKLATNKISPISPANDFTIEATLIQPTSTRDQLTIRASQLMGTNNSYLSVAAGDIAIINKMTVGASIYGTTNPNTAGISGVEGQLYFQVVS